MAFYIWVEVGVQLKLIIMWIVNSVNIWVWIGKLFIPYFISCYLTWKKNYHITFTVTLNHKTKQIETSIELIDTILTRIVTYAKFFTRYTKVFLTNQRVRYKQN